MDVIGTTVVNRTKQNLRFEQMYLRSKAGEFDEFDFIAESASMVSMYEFLCDELGKKAPRNQHWADGTRYEKGRDHKSIVVERRRRKEKREALHLAMLEVDACDEFFPCVEDGCAGVDGVVFEFGPEERTFGRVVSTASEPACWINASLQTLKSLHCSHPLCTLLKVVTYGLGHSRAKAERFASGFKIKLPSNRVLRVAATMLFQQS